LMEKLKVPVVDPALAALKMAETFVSLGLAHSKFSYPFPPK
jgi:Asp/Glu/hydantoin racemase